MNILKKETSTSLLTSKGMYPLNQESQLLDIDGFNSDELNPENDEEFDTFDSDDFDADDEIFEVDIFEDDQNFDENLEENLSEDKYDFSQKENHLQPTESISLKLENSTHASYDPSKKIEDYEAWEQFELGLYIWEEFDKKGKENIVRHYAPKIRFIALRMKSKLPKHIELNELISSGTIGLLKALSKFKPQLAIKFDSYAESRIRGTMIDELRKMDWFPRSLRSRVREINQAVWNLEHEMGRSPTSQEIATFTGLTEKEVNIGLEALQNQLCISLDAIQDCVAGDSSNSIEENPFQSTAHQELINKVASVIDLLTPREKLVLSLYYNDELNMREAAEVMDITEGRVSQLHTQAITRLRRIFNERFQDSL